MSHRSGLRAVAQICAILALPLPSSAQDSFADAVTAVREARFVAAVEGFLSLAEDGDHDAQYNLALLLKEGAGYPQNFSHALEWAILADLGGVAPAQALVGNLRARLPDDHYAEVADRTAARLEARLAVGDRDAILQFARFNEVFRPEPDLETTLLWQTIGAALGIDNAAAARDATASGLTPESLVTVQTRATELFVERNFQKLFASPDVDQHSD